MKLEDLKKPINLNNYSPKYIFYTDTESDLTISIPIFCEQIDNEEKYVIVVLDPLTCYPTLAFRVENQETAENTINEFVSKPTGTMSILSKLILQGQNNDVLEDLGVMEDEEIIEDEDLLN